ncbi:RDD family protein [Frigoriflavimonas asaccharolytica]|uniref:Putative RDD family membrane protein YckC n=1 Tax=Frigoriflavimonas asaccharolytica TaxID=2735899 RepID=A0A8J8GA71_9FLAO|nr:RDD family protein [Frigoriflavimonas asaccharolytica]NRS93485.1 putative RDD family membrane protein YckC [Frigoriflavimonas asaccharolytica]
MSQIAINTSQNVEINFTLASIGERIFAFLLDVLFLIAFMVLINLLFFKVLGLDDYFSTLSDNWSKMAIILMITFPVYIYTVTLESLMEGQTFGKKILKIKVVKIDGYQAHFSDYFVRWIFRLVDIWSNSAVVGLLFAIINKNNQRLGDLASGTAVISLKKNVNISNTILVNLAEDYQPTFPQVVILSDDDMRIIKDNFQYALKVDDQQVISKLSDKIQTLLKIEIDGRDYTDRQFIIKVIEDFNHFTGKFN